MKYKPVAKEEILTDCLSDKFPFKRNAPTLFKIEYSVNCKEAFMFNSKLLGFGNISINRLELKSATEFILQVENPVE